ncbi:MAG: histidine triad nucleotide-binding protein [candidate division Zixibacteria bacterium]|nr:histidine triad nucleotide-binding protein [candidate division Zixibacteria bacterium]
MPNCIFCKIAEHNLNADIIYEDNDIVAFRDLKPQAPTHLLLIPREHIPTIEEASPAILGKLMSKASELAKKEGISAKGYRTVINCRDYAGQSVYHLHVHLLGGRWFHWPPG